MTTPGEALMAYNFSVSVAELTMGFAEVSGLVREHKAVTYRHGLSFWEGERIAKVHDDKFVPITLKKGTTVAGAALLHLWLESKVELMMRVSQLDARGLTAVSWRILRALPVKLSAPTYDASAGQVSIDTLEVMGAGIFAHVDIPLPVVGVGV